MTQKDAATRAAERICSGNVTEQRVNWMAAIIREEFAVLSCGHAAAHWVKFDPDEGMCTHERHDNLPDPPDGYCTDCEREANVKRLVEAARLVLGMHTDSVEWAELREALRPWETK